MHELLDIPAYLKRPSAPAPTLAEAREDFTAITRRVPTMPRRTGAPPAERKALQDLGYPDWRIRSMYAKERRRIIATQHRYVDYNAPHREWQAKMDESYKARKDR